LENVNLFAGQGLRTLMFAMKEMNVDESQFDSMTQAQVEKGMTMVGVTGVEDLLQEDV